MGSGTNGKRKGGNKGHRSKNKLYKRSYKLKHYGKDHDIINKELKKKDDDKLKNVQPTPLPYDEDLPGGGQFSKVTFECQSMVAKVPHKQLLIIGARHCKIQRKLKNVGTQPHGNHNWPDQRDQLNQPDQLGQPDQPDEPDQPDQPDQPNHAIQT